jgi:hypothetical protein
LSCWSAQLAHETNDRARALRRRVADRVADTQAAAPNSIASLVERPDRLRLRSRGVFGHVHDRKLVLARERQRRSRVLQQQIESPVLRVLADVAAADERADLDRDARTLRHVDDRLDVADDGPAGDVCADAQSPVGDVLCQQEDVFARTPAGTGQADVCGVDAEPVHALDQVDLLVETRVADGRGLQAVAKRLVVELQGAGRAEPAAGLVPVVDEIRGARHA